MKDTCGNPINSLSPHLSCQVEMTAGLSVQTFFSTRKTDFTPNGAGSYSGTCNTVDVDNTEHLCELGFNAICQLVDVAKVFPGLCPLIGATIGRTLGGGEGFVIGFLFLGPGVVYSTLIGIFLGGSAATWLCQAVIAELSTICFGLTVGSIGSNLCTEIANAENVAVQAVSLPGGTTVTFPAVGSSTPGVTVTQIVDTAGAACPTPPSLPPSGSGDCGGLDFSNCVLCDIVPICYNVGFGGIEGVSIAQCPTNCAQANPCICHGVCNDGTQCWIYE
jgi:hypothetical protein